MKLLIGIVNSDDSAELISEITKAKFYATKLATSGGFLKKGNNTILIGVEEEKLDELIGIFKKCCSRRTEVISAATPFIGEGFVTSTPVEITVGGATLFVVDVDKFLKI